ncbi:MAG: hypothetical protein OXI60_07840 [Acidiferrobacterales bacterium]|nr:hypothetical protein [Acidiferrobacterales bacterium]
MSVLSDGICCHKSRAAQDFTGRVDFEAIEAAGTADLDKQTVWELSKLIYGQGILIATQWAENANDILPRLTWLNLTIVIVHNRAH